MSKTKDNHRIPSVSVSHDLAILYLKEILKKGITIEIPSLGIVIKPDNEK